MKVELIPVLEISALPEAQLQIMRPISNFQQNPIQWDEYQGKLLNLGGFDDYKRVIKGNNFLCIGQWSISDLKKLIHRHLGIGEEQTAAAESCALFGGCVLVMEDIPVLAPQCCSLISDFFSWKTLLDEKFESGYFCPEGHPSPYAKKENNTLTITCEDEWETFVYPAQQKISLTMDELADAIAKAEVEIRLFSEKIDLLSAEFGVEKLSDYMVLGK